MRGRSLTPLVALVVLAPSLASQQPTRTARTTPPAIDIPLVRKAVVTIQALDASGQLMASGTGFFVTEGYVVTAAHVLEDAAGCRIEPSDGQQLRCSVAASDSDRKSTRLNSSHGYIPYAVFCLKKKIDRARHRAANERAIRAAEIRDLRLLAVPGHRGVAARHERVVTEHAVAFFAPEDDLLAGE